MKKLIPLCIGLCTVLTACPGPFPIFPEAEQVKPTDTRLLTGHWQGDLIESRRIGTVRAAMQRLFVLENQNNIQVLDRHQGTPLGRLTLTEPVVDFAFRDSDQKLVVLTEKQLHIYDPETLQQVSTKPLAAASISEDGQTATWIDKEGKLARVNTVNDLPVLTAPNVPLYLLSQQRSSDDTWALINQRAMRLSDGVTLGGTSQHGNPCQMTSGLAPTALETAFFDKGQAEKQLLLGFADGFIEMRSASGDLVKSYRVSEKCASVVDIYSDGEYFVYLTNAGEAGIGSLATGNLGTTIKGTNGNQVTPYGVIQVQTDPNTYPSETSSKLYFTDWADKTWNLPSEQVKVDIQSNGTRQSSSVMNLVGSVTVDGKEYKAVGQLLLGENKKLTAATSPRPNWGEFLYNLKLTEGDKVVGNLSGNFHTYSSNQAYNSRLEWNNKVFSGEVRRF